MSDALREDPMFGVSGRVVVVSGGCGQLGSQFTDVLLERGARVVVMDLDADPAKDSEHLLNLVVDITNREALAEALERIQARWETPYGLINNAALDSPPGAPAEENGPFESYPESSWDSVMEVNAKGVFLSCQVFGGAMAEAGRGSIVNVGSTYGLVSPNQDLYEHRRQAGEAFYKPVAYSASKSALLNLTRYLATYWGRHGVRVNLLAPGGVFNHQEPEFLAAYHARVPMGRMAREDEYNGAVVFLLSDASTYMTGSTLVVDGGWTAW